MPPCTIKFIFSQAYLSRSSFQTSNNVRISITSASELSPAYTLPAMRIPFWGKKLPFRASKAATPPSSKGPKAVTLDPSTEISPVPTQRVIRTLAVPIQFGTSPGHQIFIYTHRATHQTLYSLYRTLNATRALKQIPFLGKKTVPAKLRRDLWTPLCVLSFPRAAQGRDAYQKLLELKHRHETEPPLSLITETEDAKKQGQRVGKVERG